MAEGAHRRPSREVGRWYLGRPLWSAQAPHSSPQTVRAPHLPRSTDDRRRHSAGALK